MYLYIYIYVYIYIIWSHYKMIRCVLVIIAGCSEAWDCHGIFYYSGDNLAMLWNFSNKACQFFKLIILISYLLDNSP